jgi:hypothetical protein
MNIKTAQYLDSNKALIKAIINDVECYVPLDPNNRHYAEILKQVQEGTLTIQDAE